MECGQDGMGVAEVALIRVFTAVEFVGEGECAERRSAEKRNVDWGQGTGVRVKKLKRALDGEGVKSVAEKRTFESERGPGE